MTSNRITLISQPVENGLGGGAKREFFVTTEFLNYIDIELYFPLRNFVGALLLKNQNNKIFEYILKSLNFLEKKGLEIPATIFHLFEEEKTKEKIDKEIKKRKLTYFLNVEKIEKIFIDNLIKRNELNPRKSKLVYSPHETIEFIYSAYYITNKLNKKASILLQESPFLRIRNLYTFVKYNSLVGIFTNYYGIKIKNMLLTMKRTKKLEKILSISYAPILLSKLSKYFKNYKVLRIGNAFDRSLIKYRKFKKKNYLVFFGRLAPEKGIFEIPFIIEEIKKVYGDVKIYIIGSFGKSSTKNKFISLVNKLNLKDNIVLTGFLDKNKMYKIISNAKLLLYPSHQDSFSLVVLETLAVGTTIVAYDIPAIRLVYKNLRPVKIVKEGNIRDMARKVIEVLEYDKGRYKEEHNDEKTINFLKQHSDWKNVAMEELKELKLVE